MPKKEKGIAIVKEQKKISAGIYDLVLETKLAKYAKPGQFIAVYPKDKSTLLPRPISICEVDAVKQTIRIVYRVAGKGTTEFSEYKKGETISILGTLGNGYPIENLKEKKVILMGGGIGIPPMLQLAKELDHPIVVLGYRDKNLFLKRDFEKYAEVYIATEDGSVEVKENVLDVMKEKQLVGDIICACGPMPMLRAIKKYAEDNEMEAYISLEERMACGVGACLGCVCKTKEIDHHSHVKNARICTDGPVFDAKEVDI